MPSSLLHAGTNGWFTVPAIAQHRLGQLGPDENPNTAPYTFRVILRTHGEHEGHLSLWEYDKRRAGSEWMLMVLDADRNVIGQVLRHTKDAARRAMNDVFESKHIGVYSARSSDAN